jgi:4'-phosphopantetheinyl transferase
MSETWNIEIPSTFVADASIGGAGAEAVFKVFDFHFCDSSCKTDARQDCLTASEQDRAGRFHHRIDRNRFVVGRSMLRQVLGIALDMSPVDVPIGLDKGRPFLDQSVFGPFFFNLSHSGNRVMMIFSRERQVGVDVEVERDFPDLEQVARRVMTNGEYDQLLAMPKAGRVAAFFRLWVRKESIMKCLGKGFEIDPRRIEVGHDASASTEGLFEQRAFHLNQFQDTEHGKSHYWAFTYSGKRCRFRLDHHSIAARFN